jgi:hypothetical protein
MSATQATASIPLTCDFDPFSRRRCRLCRRRLADSVGEADPPLDVRADDVPLSLGGRKQAADYALSSA